MIVIWGTLLYHDYHQVDTSAVFMTIIKSIPLLYWWLSSSRYLCCIYDYHQVDTSAVFMTIIKSIPLLYLWLSSSRYLCCIYDYHQVDTSAVFMTIIKSIPLLYFINDYHQFDTSSCIYDYHQFDTSAVSMTMMIVIYSCIYDIIKSIQQTNIDTSADIIWLSTYQVDTSAVFMTIIKSIPLLYIWLIKVSCCI